MIETLQGCRFVFMVLIFFHHFTWNGTGAFDFGGECGVSFFFMLSGFVLSVAYGDAVDGGTFGHRRFVVRQLTKFYPLHLLTLLAVLLLDARVPDAAPTDWTKVFLCAALLQSWLPTNDINFACNGVSWFLSDMMFFYILFPFLHSWLAHAPRRRLLLSFGAVAVAYSALCLAVSPDGVNSILYVLPPVRLIDFAIGVLLYRLYRSAYGASFGAWLGRQGMARATLFEALALLSVILCYAVYVSLCPTLRCAALFWLFLPPLILFFAVADRSGGALSAVLRSGLMQRLGGATLELFLIHGIVLRLAVGAFTRAGVDLGAVPMGLLCLFVAVALSLLTKACFTDKAGSYLRKHISIA